MTDATEVQWVDEVPRRVTARPPAYGYEVLDALKANPGRWAKLHTYERTGSAGSARRSLEKQGYEADTPGGLKVHRRRQHAA